MAFDDPTFLAKLKTAWDDYFSKNPELTLILCGSVSSWIRDNIINDTAFLGRITLDMSLDELPLNVCNEFWGAQKEKISAYEKLKLLSVTGGVPRYLELIKPNLTAEENIRQMCFIKESMLVKEFKHIFVDIFGKRSPIYESIVGHLVSGKKTADELSNLQKVSYTGTFSGYLNDLTQAGFITQDYTWSLKSGKISKLNYYRLKDNFLRFYLKYILPNKERINKGHFEECNIASLDGWQTILGLQFENLVLNNYKRIIEILNIKQENIIFDNPFFQRKTARQTGVQIDYLIQTKFNTVYLCEIKFHRNKIKTNIIDEVEKKIKALSLPRNMSIRPVLIHVNGVCDEVIDQQYFCEIIDFSELLDNNANLPQ